MKKLFLPLIMGLATLGASAQAGDVAFGVNLGVAPVLEDGASVTNIGLGAKVQLGITDPIRVEVAANYWFKDNYFSVFDLGLNGHYLIPVADRFKLYPLVGIGYGRVKASVDSDDDIWDYSPSRAGGHVTWSSSINRFLFNVGIGGEYAVSSRVSIGAEFKYQYMKDFSRMPISVGLTYKF
jgi:outer membrane protein X